MVNTFKNNWKKHLTILAILTGIVLVVFAPYILGYKQFLFSADQQLQYNYFYEEWSRMLDGFMNQGTLPFYSFKTFLGNNFFASKAYYLTGDIFIWFVKLFNNVNTGLMWETVILVVFSGYNFSLFLRLYGLKREKVIIAVSIVYAFSGIASMYVGQYMFHRFYCFMPLLFAGVELYRKTSKLAPFAIIVTLLFLSSYYFMFPTCIFLVIYYIFSKTYHSKSFNLKKILQSALPLIGAFMVGLLLSGILLIPTIMFIMGNSRVGSFSTYFIYDLQVYVGFIASYLCAPLTLYTDIPYLFTSGDNGHLTWYSLYSCVLCAPIIFSLFKRHHEDIRDKSMMIVSIILMVCALVPPLSSLFHGFSEASFRWTFIIVFFDLLVVAIYLTHFEKTSKDIVNGGLNYGIVLSILLLIGIIGGVVNLNYGEHLILIIGSFVLMGGYLLLVKRQALNIILIAMVIECAGFEMAHLLLLNQNYYTYTDSLNSDYITYNDLNDEDKFYRMYVSPDELLPTSTMNLNQSLHIGYKSTTAYDSTYEQSVSPFLKMNGIDWHIININDIDVLRMLGVKYYYVTDETQLPSNYTWTYYTNVNHFMVYKMEEYRPIGFTYSNFTTDTPTDWNNQLYIGQDLVSQVSDINSSGSINFELQEYPNDNNLYGHINNDVKQVLFLSIPYSEGWKVYDNGVPVTTYNVQGGFIGLVLEPGDHGITLKFTPPGFKYGAYASLLGGVLLIVLIVLDVSKAKREKKTTGDTNAVIK